MPMIDMHNIFKTIKYFACCDLWLFFLKYTVCASPYNGAGNLCG